MGFNHELIYKSLTTFLVLSCLSGILFVLYMSRNYTYWKRKGVPYIKPKLFFGNAFNTLTLKVSVADFFREIHENCKGPFVGFYILDQPCLLIKDLDLVKDIFVKNSQIFPDRTGSADELKDPISYNGLFVATAPNWSTQRKNAVLAYSSGMFKSQVSYFPAIATQMIDYMRKKISIDGSVLSIKDVTNRYTVRTITKSFYGITENTFEKENSPFMWLTERIFNYKSKFLALVTMCTFLTPKWARLLGFNFIDTASAQFFKDLTSDLIETRQKMNVKNNDLVDILLNIKNKQNIQDLSSFEANCLVSRVFEIFAAGYETSSTTITQTLFELAKNPEYQTLARKDIRENIKKYGGITYESVNAMKYLEKCINETLRLHPLSVFLDRRSIQKYQIPGTDIVLDEGQAIYISPRGFHHDPEYYPNPYQYDPERFTEENINSRPDYAYMPFGFGARACPGKRFATKTTLTGLAYILSNFEVSLPEGAPKTIEIQEGGVTAQPKYDIYLRFKEIS